MARLFLPQPVEAERHQSEEQGKNELEDPCEAHTGRDGDERGEHCHAQHGIDVHRRLRQKRRSAPEAVAYDKLCCSVFTLNVKPPDVVCDERVVEQKRNRRHENDEPVGPDEVSRT